MFINSIILSIILFITPWQNSLYDKLINTIYKPFYPITTIIYKSNYTLDFTSYAAYYDPADKYYFVTHDIKSIPTWIFVMNYNNKNHDELWHRGIHNGILCNEIKDNKILLHLKTVGKFKANLFFHISYNVTNTKYGTVTSINIDKNYKESDIDDIELYFWTFPHPTIKSLVIVAVRGHIKTNYPISFFSNSIRWHIDTMLENFGKRLISI